MIGPHDPCQQEWQAVIEVGPNTCVLDGSLVFNSSTLLCRDLPDSMECPLVGFYETTFALTAENIAYVVVLVVIVVDSVKLFIELWC